MGLVLRKVMKLLIIYHHVALCLICDNIFLIMKQSNARPFVKSNAWPFLRPDASLFVQLNVGPVLLSNV